MSHASASMGESRLAPEGQLHVGLPNGAPSWAWSLSLCQARAVYSMLSMSVFLPVRVTGFRLVRIRRGVIASSVVPPFVPGVSLHLCQPGIELGGVHKTEGQVSHMLRRRRVRLAHC
nr:MAG TPA: hypothetical protein [Caudoviricetes sp.]